MEGLTSGGIQPAVLQEVLPHFPTRSRGIERREVGDSRASLGKGRASSGAGTLEGQMHTYPPTPNNSGTPHSLPACCPAMLTPNLLTCCPASITHSFSPGTHPKEGALREVTSPTPALAVREALRAGADPNPSHTHPLPAAWKQRPPIQQGCRAPSPSGSNTIGASPLPSPGQRWRR